MLHHNDNEPLRRVTSDCCNIYNIDVWYLYCLVSIGILLKHLTVAIIKSCRIMLVCLIEYPFHLLFLFHISIYLYSSFYSLFLVVAYQSSSAINQQNSTEHMMCTIAYLCHHVQELFLYSTVLAFILPSPQPRRTMIENEHVDHLGRFHMCVDRIRQETMHLTSMFYLIESHSAAATTTNCQDEPPTLLVGT